MASVDLKNSQLKNSKNPCSLDGNPLFPHRNRSALASLPLRGLFIFCIVFFFCQIECAYAVDTTKAVIHHTSTATDKNKDPSAAEINRWHKERGWDEIGYHFVIRKDGTIEEGRSLNKQGAHARNPSPSRNGWVGIVLTGYDEFTPNQISSLKILLTRLNIKHVERHHEECPGKTLNVEEIFKMTDSLTVENEG